VTTRRAAPPRLALRDVGGGNHRDESYPRLAQSRKAGNGRVREADGCGTPVEPSRVMRMQNRLCFHYEQITSNALAWGDQFQEATLTYI